MTLGKSSNGPMTAEKDRESFCPDCGARITDTPTYGEVGHRRNCPRREDRYVGRDVREFNGIRNPGREGSA